MTTMTATKCDRCTKPTKSLRRCRVCSLWVCKLCINWADPARCKSCSKRTRHHWNHDTLTWDNTHDGRKKREISNVQQQAERLELPALSADDQTLIWTIQHGTNLNAHMIW